MLKIVTAPNSVLSEKAKPVSKIDKDTLRLIKGMKETLASTKDPEGVGLAAPQVGKSLQIFIVQPTKKSKVDVFINPVIQTLSKTKQFRPPAQTSTKASKQTKLEGCLSLLNIWGEVKRHSSLVLSYLDEKGHLHTNTFDGLLATIIQHEYDHLQGILFPKKVLEQKGDLYKSHKNEKNEDVFDKIEL